MDTQRRRQLRRKYMAEEDRLHKSVLGRPYDAGDDDFDMDYKEERKDYSPKLPKYKARTFKNILREYDEPDFDERENSLKEYVREEIPPTNDETIVKNKIDDKLEEPQPISEETIEEQETFAEEEFAKEQMAEEPLTVQEDYSPSDEVHEPVRQSILEPEEAPVPSDFPSDYEPQPIRRRKTLRQMEREERKARHESANRTLHSNNNLSRSSAPRPVRIIAFLALMIFSFVLGYYLCGGIFRLTNFTPTTSEEPHQTTEETQPQPVTTQATSATGATKPATIYLPKDGAIVSATIEQKGASSNEQMLKDVLTSCLTSIKEAGFLSPETELAQLWITQDTLNLSFNQGFVADMKKLNAQEATLVLQSILRTANANLSSVKNLKLYADFSPLTETKPIDFTKPWGTM